MRRFAYTLLTRLAVPPWLLAMLSLAVAYRLAVLAYRIDPTATPPNCWIAAAIEWCKGYRAWALDGYPPGREPYGVVRHSRTPPKWVLHALVGMRDDSGFMDLTSFKPDTPTPARWWELHKRTEFDGSAKRGD